MRRFVAPLVYGLLALCLRANLTAAHAQAAPPSLPADHYAIYARGERVGIEAMADALAKADVVFVGEEHDHTLGHLLELEILTALHARRPKMALALEMFERDVQTVVDEYVGGYIAEPQFLAAARPWPNYKTDYRPLVEFCAANRVPLVGSNAPRRYVSIVSRKGKEALDLLPRESRAYLPRLPYDMALPAEYDRQLTALFEGQHGGGGMPAGAMPTTEHMKQAQALWDSTMADSVRRARRGGRLVLHMNGAMHSDSGFGIVDRLRRADGGVKVLLVSIKREPGFPNLPSGKYDGVADYLILTPPDPAKQAAP